ncbi:MAG: lysylphosphatidylglycerol synthase transmembrane domain-containing protein [Mariprofundaceae bacterium]|nr:lysylphosphatidylglycerol synthase transmembrane domain-containing protein [Mariprofundaceae bacterium]
MLNTPNKLPANKGVWILRAVTHPVLKAFITVLLLTLLIYYLDLVAVWARIIDVNLWYVMAAISCMITGYILCGIRWMWIAKGLGMRVSPSRKVQLYFLGMFTSLFLPSTIGGDVVRGVLLAKGEGRSGMGLIATASVILDRANGLFALITLLTVCMFWFSWPAIWWWLWSVAIITAWSTMMLYPRIHQHLPQKMRRIQNLPLDQSSFHIQWWRSLPVSLLFQIMIIQAHVFLGMAVGLAMPWPAFAMMVGLVALVAILPISLNGFGVREAGYVGLAVYFGGNNEAAAAMAALWVFVLVVSALPGAWVLWRLGGIHAIHRD